MRKPAIQTVVCDAFADENSSALRDDPRSNSEVIRMAILRRITTAVFLIMLISGGTVVRALPAYIDIQSGIIIGRGEAKMTPGKAYEDARRSAVENAKDNILKVLERQPIDLESIKSRTIGDYLADLPSAKAIVDSFIESAVVFRESRDSNGVVQVTLTLPVEGEKGYKGMLARLTGKTLPGAEKQGPVFMNDVIDDEIKQELKNRVASANEGEAGRTKRLILFNFSNNTDFVKLNLGDIFSQKIEEKFKRDHRIEFVTGREAERLIAESGIDINDIVQSDANRKFKIKGVDGLIDGAVLKYGATAKQHGVGGTGYIELSFDVAVELKVLDARAGRWVYFDVVPASLNDRMLPITQGDNPDQVIMPEELNSQQGLAARTFNAAVTAAENIIKNTFPTEGYVLKVIGNRVYINFSQSDGLKEGDVLTVYRLGEILVDPVSGEQIDRIK
ncbi:MAG TPA: hypothetical protein PLQ76_05055, partial [bacterium]|nr:hypothetical protein [bacterium]